MEFWIFLIFFLLALVIAIGFVVPIYKKHNKATGGIINHDSIMRKYVYKVALSKDDIIRLLETSNDGYDLFCVFDFDKSIIKFSEYGMGAICNRKYYFTIQEFDGFSILRLEQVELFGAQSYIPYKLNPFMVSKLNAEIIPFSQYGF